MRISGIVERIHRVKSTRPAALTNPGEQDRCGAHEGADFYDDAIRRKGLHNCDHFVDFFAAEPTINRERCLSELLDAGMIGLSRNWVKRHHETTVGLSMTRSTIGRRSPDASISLLYLR